MEINQAGGTGEGEARNTMSSSSSSSRENAASAFDDNAPDSLCCPIAKTIMEDPVLAMDGHTYDRRSIEQWFQTKVTSPLTGLTLPSKTLFANIAMRKVIDEHRERAKTVPKHNFASVTDAVTAHLKKKPASHHDSCFCATCRQEVIEALHESAAMEVQINELTTALYTAKRVHNDRLTKIDEKQGKQRRRMAEEAKQRQYDMIRQTQEVEREHRRQQMNEQLRQDMMQREAAEAREREEQERFERERQEQQHLWYVNYVETLESGEHYCHICKVRESRRNQFQMRKHIMGRRHEAMLEQVNQYQNQFACVHCNVFVQSMKTFWDHLRGQRHIQNTSPTDYYSSSN